MTKQEILEKLEFDMELRSRTKDTIRDYEMHVRLNTHFHAFLSFILRKF